MNTRSLKFRLAAWYAGWLTLLFVVFGFFVYASLDHYLRLSLREALARRTRQVANMAERVAPEADWKAISLDIQRNFAPEANNRFTRVTINDVIHYVSGRPGDRSFDPQIVPPAPETAQQEIFDRRILPDETVLLIVVVTRNVDGRKIVVEEGSAEAPITLTLHRWLAALVVALTVLVVVSILGGYLLVQRSLHPVSRIIRSAKQIRSHNLSERLPVPDTGDELEDLSTSLNEMIHRLEESFHHAQRFLADASHELRTPLTMMRAEIDEIIKRAGERSDVRTIAESALEEVIRLRNIVEGLLAVSRLDAGEAQMQWERFDLGELVASTTEQICPLADEKRISIRCRTLPNVMVEGDRARLKQVTVNLLDNAIKYTQEGGRIGISVTARNHTAILEVSDNGIGIPANALPLVFDRFYRVDKARSRELGGAGLGLSIVKAICVAHGGKVEAHSVEGEGTRLVVELPIASDHPMPRP